MLGGGNASISRTANVMGLAEYGSGPLLGFCGASVWSVWCSEEGRCLRGHSVEVFDPFWLQHDAEGS